MIVSCIAPRWTGMCGAFATSPPSWPNMAHEKSKRSYDTNKTKKFTQSQILKTRNTLKISRKFFFVLTTVNQEASEKASGLTLIFVESEVLWSTLII